jgi:hypothetical protein
MDDHYGNVTPGDGAQWIGLGEAARRLGVTRAAIYGRIERKTLTTRPKGNRGLEVLWTLPQHHHDRHGDIPPNGDGDIAAALAAELRARLEQAEGEALQLRGQVADLRVELGAAREQVAAAQAVAISDVEAAQRIAEAEIAAKETVIIELKAMLADARRPWWRRWLG